MYMRGGDAVQRLIPSSLCMCVCCARGHGQTFENVRSANPGAAAAALWQNFVCGHTKCMRDASTQQRCVRTTRKAFLGTCLLNY